MAGSWAYNEVTFKVSHNSFERDERPVTDQLAFDERDPHQGGCRGLELDLRESPNLTMWAVDHDEYTSRADRQFPAFLQHLRRWSRFHPEHDVVLVTVDLKARARNVAEFPLYLDDAIDEHLGRERLYSPGDLRGHGTSLVEAAMATGWPSLDDLRGRFVLCLSGDEITKRSYAASDPERLCFADVQVEKGDPRPSTTDGDRVFFNFNATEAWSWDRELRWFAGQRGFLTRAYGVNHRDLWTKVVRAGANLVATDKVRNHGWARVGTRPFRRHATDLRPPRREV